MFGADEQVSGRGQTYLSDIGLTVMWEKQGTSTPQSEEAEFDLLCQLSPGLAPHPPPCRRLFLRCCEVMTSANSLSLILRRAGRGRVQARPHVRRATDPHGHRLFGTQGQPSKEG